MDKRTLAALKDSIENWKGVSEGKERKDCALCEEFPDQNCMGCPVKEKTGHPSCEGTPFYAVRISVGTTALYDWQRVAARREYLFLKSLLPKKRKGGK
jgi:hypothetical protein